MEMKQNLPDVSYLRDLPREVLEQIQKLRQFSNIRTREDSEVERCFPDLRSPLKGSDGNVFKFPREIPHLNENSRNYIPSPKSNKTMCGLYGDNSDWMMAEKTKSRTPPASPVTPSSSHSLSFRYSPSASKQQRVENIPEDAPKVAGDDEVVYCVPRTTVISQENIKTNLERTPSKQIFNFQDISSPFRRSPPSPTVRRSPSCPSVQEDVLRSRLGDTVDHGGEEHKDLPNAELTRSARKQLNFDACSHKTGGSLDDLYFSSDRSRSPFKSRRESSLPADDDLEEQATSRLVLHLLSQLRGQGRKRKASDCCSCDFESDCDRESVKRQRSDQMYRFQGENEFYRRRMPEPQELIPDNCTCALMEKEFLKMAEHAYKNIRRQDGSSESFNRFQKELSETNSIINESLTVLKNMKSICEHRRLNKF